MDFMDRLGFGPHRQLTQNWDNTFTLVVTPPDWTGLSPTKIKLTEDQAAQYEKWGTKIALIQQALPDLTEDQRQVILTGMTPKDWELIGGTRYRNRNTSLGHQLENRTMATHEELFENLKSALDAYLADDSVDNETRKTELEEIQDKVDTRISDIEDEIESEGKDESGEEGEEEKEEAGEAEGTG